MSQESMDAQAPPVRILLADLRNGPVKTRWRLTDAEASLGNLPFVFSVVDVWVEARPGAGQDVWVVGRLRARGKGDCRRCLATTSLTVAGEWKALFRSKAEAGEHDEADSVWAIDVGAGELDLARPVREEIWLQAPDDLVCEDDCLGLCDGCGCRLGDETCTCAAPAPDARWSALLDAKVEETGSASG